MGTTNHFPDCWRQEDHPACRLAYIHDLKVKVLALETQLQYERTGHLTPYVAAKDWTLQPISGAPCHDHIEPPIVSGGPTWASRNDEPPSFTP